MYKYTVFDVGLWTIRFDHILNGHARKAALVSNWRALKFREALNC